MMRVYFDSDSDPTLVLGRAIAVIGYGNQGRAQAFNLRDSGARIIIGLDARSPSRGCAAEDGFEVMTSDLAAPRAEILVMLFPDETQALYAD